MRDVKCPSCGYEDEIEVPSNKNFPVYEKVGESFISIDGMFLVENSSWRGGKHQVSLVACPKCKTVILRD